MIRGMFLFFFLVLISYLTYGQKATFKEIKRTRDICLFISGKDTADIIYGNKIIYPLIQTGNKKTDELINRTIRYSLEYDSSFKKTPINIAIDSFIREGLINMHYFVTFNNNNILSLHLRYEHCGANCWINDDFLNFDLSTGRLLSIDDMITKAELNNFKKKVTQDNKVFLDKWLKNFEKQFKPNRKKNEVELSVENWINDCKLKMDFSRFEVSPSGILIFSKCYFGTWMRGYEPSTLLKYSYKEYKKIFNEVFLKKLTQ